MPEVQPGPGATNRSDSGMEKNRWRRDIAVLK